MIYFAYGSNMHWPRIHSRCPSASFMGRAVLKNHSLKFTRQSISLNSGVADIVPSHGDMVWGVLFRIDESDIPALDEAEGYRPGRSVNAYIRQEVTALSEGNDKLPMTVMGYTVQSKSPVHITPSSEYLGFLIQGAKHWNLPADYIEKLKSIEVKA